MNIKQAKDYIKDSVRIYLKKDEFGDYRIPVVRQRPIFLLGAPGIGKTAIMEQIADELGIALVAYSMTHHTRQSAIGLPMIKQKTYGGEEYDVSEYTMSEIIASIFETIEQSGVKEGILFLDEINCVSETLAPSMLQFLQYKVFGKHQVPEGFVIVTAGNPPEYNKSVREFDVVTMDRLKLLNVEADYATWKGYAVSNNVHNAITSFLELHKDYFYNVETTVRGRSYVTARGWEDLSEIIQLYEEENMVVSEELIEQYIRNSDIVKEFAAYYDLYNKYKSDYNPDIILSGDENFWDNVKVKIETAKFDEKLSLLGMLIDKVSNDMRHSVITADFARELLVNLKAIKESNDLFEAVDKQIELNEKNMEVKAKANSLSKENKLKLKKIIAFLYECKSELSKDCKFDVIKTKYDAIISDMRMHVEKTDSKLTNLFDFVKKVFGEGNEMLVLVTELTVDTYSSQYISMFGSESYIRYNKLLMVSERKNDMRANIEKLEL